MERRQFIERAAGILAALLADEVWAADLVARPNDATRRAARPGFLASGEQALIAAISDGIIPKTETPGAIEAGVPDFIGLLASDWMLPAEQQSFRLGLAELDERARAAQGAHFVELSGETRLKLLSAWDQESVEARGAGKPPPFFTRLKTLVLVGYYTSAAGQNEELKVQFGGGADEPGGPACLTIPMRM